MRFASGGVDRWAALLVAIAFVDPAHATSTPEWMRSQLSAPIPVHDDKTDAVILYDETVITAQPNGRIKHLSRQVIKILRPDGESYGKRRFYYSPDSRILALHAWSIPPDGKDYELKDKEIVDAADVDIDGGELITDLRMKVVAMPGAHVGTLVGFEVEQEERPELLASSWEFQDTIPVRESRYTLKLPPGWSYESTWLNHPSETAVNTGANQWSWVMTDVSPVKVERFMPPWRGIASYMVVSLSPPGGKSAGIKTWNDIGVWYTQLIKGRRDATPAIKQKVAEVTANAPSVLAKMQALAKFVQTDIRYVAIELGIGGQQPHPAGEIFSHRYGDCKDKVTLLSAMLKEIGVDSYYVIINTERGSVSASSLPNLMFNHAIMAVALPEGAPPFPGEVVHASLGRLLFFDPTDALTPFGSLPGYLQANYGLLVTPNGGELQQLPQLRPELSGVLRTAKMELDDKGSLKGEINEVHLGGSGATQRYQMRSFQQDTDRVRPIERLAGQSLSNFQVLKASINNLRAEDKPFEWHYTLQVDNYAKAAGELLLVRPRFIGTQAAGFLEGKEPRVHAIEFYEPERDTDVFEIVLPAGYVVDELPPAVDIDDGFATYHSKSEFSGHTLKYTRTLEFKDLSVPVEKADQLRKFYRQISSDERNSAVLKHNP
jgi:Domain of Unknown Function with PDB structure (DUF3857)/Transglutaminase-like superfamily